jgi:hypothetical protein
MVRYHIEFFLCSRSAFIYVVGSGSKKEKLLAEKFRDGIMDMDVRGLQCFKLNGNHTENDRYWQKNKFLLFSKCLKMYSFFRNSILILQKVLL